MKVYIVECGEYEQTYVLGVFSTPEKAKAAAAKYKGDVLVFELDEPSGGELLQGMKSIGKT